MNSRHRLGVLAIGAGVAAFSAGGGAGSLASIQPLPSVAGRGLANTALALAAPLSDGSPLSYQQFPPVLAADTTASVRIVLDVVGDVPSVLFRRNVPTVAVGHVEEEWPRVTTRSAGGRLISVFEQTYPADILADVLVYPHGNDRPQVPLGRLDDPAGGGGTATVWLRVAPSNLPASTVRRIASAEGGEVIAQYASHVVNLVVPGFDDARVDPSSGGYAQEAASNAFYRYFADQYQSLAFVPHRAPLADADQFARSIVNDIQGIGIPMQDDRAAFGGDALRSVQLLPVGFVGQHATFLHQLAHHWGDEMNLGAIAGLEPGDDEPDRHTPLLYPGVTLVGGVLDGTRHVERVVTDAGAESFSIARPPSPVEFHPLQLYRMGLLAPADLPTVTVFADQAQFGSRGGSAPSVGSPVVGVGASVDANAIVAALGPRDGPIFTEWHLAVVIVSDTLVSQAEMDYYNFYARRAGAPAGTRSYDGFGSFREATGGRASLRTAIQTRDSAVHPVVTESVDVSDVAFGARDWRGLIFDEPVPSQIRRSTDMTLSGRIDSDVLAGSYQFLVVRASRLGDPPEAATTVQTSVSAGRFALSLRLPDDGAGAYTLDAFVFVDVAAAPIPTSVVTPLFVD